MRSPNHDGFSISAPEAHYVASSLADASNSSSSTIVWEQCEKLSLCCKHGASSSSFLPVVVPQSSPSSSREASLLRCSKTEDGSEKVVVDVAQLAGAEMNGTDDVCLLVALIVQSTGVNKAAVEMSACVLEQTAINSSSNTQNPFLFWNCDVASSSDADKNSRNHWLCGYINVTGSLRVTIVRLSTPRLLPIVSSASRSSPSLQQQIKRLMREELLLPQQQQQDDSSSSASCSSLFEETPTNRNKLRLAVRWKTQQQQTTTEKSKTRDIDLGCFCVDSDGCFINAVYWGNLSAFDGAVSHGGDDVRSMATVREDGEAIQLDLEKLGEDERGKSVAAVAFVVSDYSSTTQDDDDDDNVSADTNAPLDLTLEVSAKDEHQQEGRRNQSEAILQRHFSAASTPGCSLFTKHTSLVACVLQKVPPPNSSSSQNQRGCWKLVTPRFSPEVQDHVALCNGASILDPAIQDAVGRVIAAATRRSNVVRSGENERRYASSGAEGLSSEAPKNTQPAQERTASASSTSIQDMSLLQKVLLFLLVVLLAYVAQFY